MEKTIEKELSLFDQTTIIKTVDKSLILSLDLKDDVDNIKKMVINEGYRKTIQMIENDNTLGIDDKIKMMNQQDEMMQKRTSEITNDYVKIRNNRAKIVLTTIISVLCAVGTIGTVGYVAHAHFAKKAGR